MTEGPQATCAVRRAQQLNEAGPNPLGILPPQFKKPAALEPSPHHEQNQETFFRNCFISPRRRFESTKRRLVALERFAFRRRSLETSARCD